MFDDVPFRLFRSEVKFFRGPPDFRCVPPPLLIVSRNRWCPFDGSNFARPPFHPTRKPLAILSPSPRFVAGM